MKRESAAIEKTVVISKAEYGRLLDEVTNAEQRHGLELAKIEAAYQKRVTALQAELERVRRERDAIWQKNGGHGPCDPS